ncbi:MAG: beta-lactamase family protein [Rhodanobacteraceae bacterium]|nr:beta-lactamase family protein [Rhodanobacteraceae bacterium]
MPGARVLMTLPALCLALAQALAAQEAPAEAPTAEAPPAEAPMVEAPLPVAPASPAATANAAPPPLTTMPPSAGGIAAIDEPASPAATVMPPDERALLQARVDAIVHSLQREHDLAALTVSVVRDDTLWLAQGYGLADVASARPVVAETTLFRIGSVSKTFIWTAVMMLAERGQIDLDADVNRYLKTVRIADAFGVPVTMRQLMHHRAGFEDSLRLFTVRDDDPRTLAELLAEQQPARVYAPGLRTSYSNWGSALAAQIVADISGKPYGEFLQGEILDPLGMRATTFVAPSRLDEATRALLATGYKEDQGALGLQDFMQIGAYWPAGGIASTATDMARWMRFHLNGGELDGVRLMTADTHARMWTRAYDDRPEAPDLAHGFQDRRYQGLRLLGHGGATSAFYSNLVLVPELKLGIFVSQSSRQSRLLMNQLPEMIVDEIRGTGFQPALAAGSAEPGALSDLAGTYLQNRRVFSSFATLFGLDATATVAPVSADALVLTQDDQATQYRRVGKERDVFESAAGARIAFVREGNAVVALADSSGVHTLEKVGLLGNPQTALGALGAAVFLSLTTLLGFWWRLGRGPGYGQGPAAGFAASASLLASLTVVGFVAVVIRMLSDLSVLDSAVLTSGYPLPSMLHTHYAGWAVAGAAALLWLAWIPAWKADGWGLWRRLHYSAYALTLGLAAFLLWQWRLYGAPVY